MQCACYDHCYQTGRRQRVVVSLALRPLQSSIMHAMLLRPALSYGKNGWMDGWMEKDKVGSFSWKRCYLVIEQQGWGHRLTTAV
jgi:hypothetical protein